MSIVFAHDHKFRRINGKLYSPGGLPNDVFTRYTSVFGEVTVIARIITEEKDNAKYSQITNNKVTILDRSALSNAIREADGVIARLPSLIGLLAIREAKKQKKSYLVEVVGCAWDAYWNYGCKGKIVAPIAFLLMKAQVRKAPFVVYVTNIFLQKRYPTNGLHTNCSNVNISKADVDVLDKRIKRIERGNSHYVIGTTAAIDVPYKGQRFVVDAIKLLNEKGIDCFEYQMVGGGSAESIYEYAVQSKVEKRVTALGSMPHEDVIKWLDTIDIYIQPSLSEGLPRALIEAMSRGLPCIGTNAGGIDELIEKKYIIPAKRQGSIGKQIGAAIEEICRPDEMVRQAKINFNRANSLYISSIIEQNRQSIFFKFKSQF